MMVIGLDGQHCEICGERIRSDEAMAEMYDPKAPATVDSVICHAECGLGKGYEVA